LDMAALGFGSERLQLQPAGRRYHHGHAEGLSQWVPGTASIPAVAWSVNANAMLS
jgi:hypothetical protein